MFTRLYYKRESDKRRVLPYLIVFPSMEAMYDFMTFLKEEGLEQVAYPTDYRGLFVNMEFKTFGPIQKAVKPVCVGDRYYTPEEFMEEVFKPYKYKLENSGRYGYGA